MKTTTAIILAATVGTLLTRPLCAQFGPIWTNAVIPYEIEEGYPERPLRVIQEAIADWTDNTIITMRPRTERDDNYLYIQWSTAGDYHGRYAWNGSCGRPASVQGIGMRGGMQRMCLPFNPEEPDSRTDYVNGYEARHEIGHVVGLIHEFERPLRDSYLSVRGGFGGPIQAFDYTCQFPWNFATVMQGGGKNTIPHGIEGAPRPFRLSPGTIDRVFWMYNQGGYTQKKTFVTTHPPDLPVRVAGETRESGEFTLEFQTLVNLDAFETLYELVEEGGTLIASAISEGFRREETGVEGVYRVNGYGRYYKRCVYDVLRFARWNTDKPKQHNVRISQCNTWHEANYVRIPAAHVALVEGDVCPQYPMRIPGLTDP